MLLQKRKLVGREKHQAKVHRSPEVIVRQGGRVRCHPAELVADLLEEAQT